MKHLFLYTTLFICQGLLGQSGVIDPTFGTGGYHLQSFLPTRDSYSDMAVAADGSIWAMGSSGFTYDYLLAKFTPNGLPDSSFSGIGWTSFDYNGNTDQGRTMELQQDGKILLAGGVVTNGRDWGILRLQSNGIPDSSFGTNGWAVIDWNGFDEVYDLLVQPDGKILASGIAGSPLGLAVARFTKNGIPDSSFATNGRFMLADGGSTHMAMDNDQNIYLVDVFGSALVQFGVMKLNSQGQVVTSFGTDGLLTIDLTNFPNSPFILFDNAGLIVFGGTDGTSLGVGEGVVLARISTSGVLDPTFDGDGKVTINTGSAQEGSDLIQLPNGHLLVAGAATPNANADMALFCIRPNGSLETTFGNGGIATVDIGGIGEWGYNVGVQPDGKIILGGSHFDAYSQFALARFSNGPLTSISGPALSQLRLTLAPNPANGEVAISFDLPQPGKVACVVTDLHGRTVFHQNWKAIAAGNQKWNLDLPATLAPGIYHLSLKTEVSFGATALIIR